MFSKWFTKKTEPVRPVTLEPAPLRDMLDYPLLQFGSCNFPPDSITIRDAVQSVIILGGNIRCSKK